MGYYVKIHPDNPQMLKIEEAAKILEKGGLVVFPTDTIYAIGASSKSSKGLDALAKFKGLKLEKSKFSFLFYDLSHLSEYTKNFDTHIYKLLKRNLPGPYTFVMEANSTIRKIFKSKKKEIGIRVPDNNIPRELVKALGHPIAATSLHHEDEIIEYIGERIRALENLENCKKLKVKN